MDKKDIPLTNEERKATIKMSGEKCKTYGSTSIFDCHCNDCYENISGYLGKKKGRKYLYTGKFTPEYMRGKHVIIKSFCAYENDKTSSCECFIKMADKEYGCEWIPRDDIINNLLEVADE